MSKSSVPKSFCSVDASTASIAFAFFIDSKLEKYGKVLFSGSGIYEKIADTAKKTQSVFKEMPTEYMVIEKTIFANSPMVAANLALSQGALIAGASMSGVSHVHSMAPISWQSYIGNPLIKKEEKEKIKKNNPGMSKAWYKTKERSIRKERTIDIVSFKYNINITDNDIADAIGIGMFSIENWDKVVK
jgi:Holliday junction resolvasome RuvABC endonuclease subunit